MADDFIAQIHDDMRQQRLRAQARRFGAVAAGVLVLAGIAGGVWGWQRHALKTAQEAASGRYFTAMSTLEAHGSAAAEQQAQATLQDLADHGPKGVRTYAALRLADYKAQHQDVPAAQALWAHVADDDTALPAMRTVARYLGLNVQQPTAQNTASLRAGYTALAQGNDAWASLAREGLVSLDLAPGATAQQKEEARRLLNQTVSSPTAPEGARSRAEALLETLGDAG
nr:tetratricopeptide repeat protein [uncultured Neokomagataea sp.]